MVGRVGVAAVVAPALPALRGRAPGRRRGAGRPARPCRADVDDVDKEGPSEEAIENLESRLGVGRKARGEPSSRPSPPGSAGAPGTSGSDKAVWKEGSLLPEGWDGMDTGTKVTEALYGERGFLYWLNWLAFRSVFVLVGLWICFRFIGPSLNLYQLTSPFDPPL